MLQFIPLEDDWDALERLRPEELIPYRVGLLPEPASRTRSMSGASPRTPPPRPAVQDSGS